jgi:hypothetical protein
MMSNDRSSIAASLFLLGFAVAASGGAAEKRPSSLPAKAPKVRYGIPRLAPGQLWVTSVPTGLEVRMGDNPVAGKVVGRTPVLVRYAEAPRFVTVVLLREEYGADLPPQMDLGDFTAKTTHSGVHQDAGKQVDFLRALTYEVKPGRQTVIALFQSRSLPLSKVARHFPPGSNFDFPDATAAKLLAERGVPTPVGKEAIDLLHRGGKVVVRTGQTVLVAEVTAPGVVQVFDLAAELAAPRPTASEPTP